MSCRELYIHICLVILEWVAIPFSWVGDPGLGNPGTEPGSPALQADSLPSEPLRKHLLVMHICD